MIDVDRSNIYQLHIPRTSGVFIREHLLREFDKTKSFASHYKKIETDSFSKHTFVSGHFGISPIKDMNSPVVFSTLRNPVERFISYFKYVYPLVSKNDINVEFDRWINDESISRYHKNTQLKFLSNPIDISLYNLNIDKSKRIIENWFIGQEENIKLAKDFIDSNYVFTTENTEKLCNEIVSLFKISPFPHNKKINGSNENGLIITKKQYAKIEELNSLDMEIYEYAKEKK